MGSDLRLSQTYRDDSGEIPKDTVEHVKQDIDQPAEALGKDRNVLPEQIYQDSMYLEQLQYWHAKG